ncbi:MAG: hypothetical protein ACRDOX_00060 [Nocardioides sp.]
MSKPIRHLIAILAATAAAVSVGTLPADAAARTAPSVSFFQGGEGKAHWSHDESTSDDRFSMKLEVPFFNLATDPVNYAGIDLHHVEGQPAPEEAPSFDFYSTASGPSLGSPRLHINFSDGGSADLRPLAWVQDIWTTVDGDGTNWDNNGGPCGFQFGTTYAAVVACHPGTTVTSAYVVSDSGYGYPEGYVHYIDNLQYDGVTISQPSDNRRG